MLTRHLSEGFDDRVSSLNPGDEPTNVRIERTHRCRLIGEATCHKVPIQHGLHARCARGRESRRLLLWRLCLDLTSMIQHGMQSVKACRKILCVVTILLKRAVEQGHIWPLTKMGKSLRELDQVALTDTLHLGSSDMQEEATHRPMERFHRSGGLKTQPNRFLDQLGGPLSETQLLHHGPDSETRHGNDPLPIKLSIAAEAKKQEVAPQVTRSHVTARLIFRVQPHP